MNQQSIKYKLAGRLRALREKQGLTQQKLARLADIDYKHVQRLEGKNPTDIRIAPLEKIAKAFGVPLWKLLHF